MPTLSVAMIVKNEAENLARCLESIYNWVDEIIILDSGSTDNTKEIALRYNAKFFENFEWPGFGKQRQIAQQYVTSDYVLWLDADEQVTSELKISIQEAINHNEPNTVYRIVRLGEAFGKKIRHSGWYPDYVVRMYPTGLARYNDNLVHEKVVYPQSALVKTLSGDLLHYTYKDIHQYLIKSTRYSHAWAEQRFNQGKKGSIFEACIHSIGCFVKMYLLNLGFLDGKQGLLLAILYSNYTFQKYAELWDKTREI
ncbi:glycosyltransferase family 2 protein [Otariodibacter sp.]|uniref:glycosyltransferase family 2 protein n=1 Tax=Otariodibacter sp. TaxID=3030919 RepID=UPI0026161D66|nr:glycosyltransferase family 2 protein [Otariodibacter sp.]